MKLRSIEVTGATIQAAVEDGLSQLGLERDQVEIEIVREPSRGVLGIGARDAIVRLTETIVAPPSPEPEFLPPVETDEPRDTKAEQTPEPVSVRSPEEVLNLAKDILVELLEKMQIDANIDARIEPSRFPGDEQALILDLQGNDLGFLIGRKGTTLAAIQHIVRLMVNKATQQRANLIVDVEGYKVRRERALKKLALRIADKATKRNRRIALEPMNAYERRIVHMTLRNHPTVVTESIGEKDRRKVTILPKS